MSIGSREALRIELYARLDHDAGERPKRAGNLLGRGDEVDYDGLVDYAHCLDYNVSPGDIYQVACDVAEEWERPILYGSYDELYMLGGEIESVRGRYWARVPGKKERIFYSLGELRAFLGTEAKRTGRRVQHWPILGEGEENDA